MTGKSILFCYLVVRGWLARRELSKLQREFRRYSHQAEAFLHAVNFKIGSQFFKLNVSSLSLQISVRADGLFERALKLMEQDAARRIRSQVEKNLVRALVFPTPP